MIDHLKIGNWRYSIEIVSNDDFDAPCFGERIVTPCYKKIKINRDSDERQRKSTLLHEALHSIEYHYGIDLSEKQVKALSNCLFELFENNPHLINMYRGQIENRTDK